MDLLQSFREPRSEIHLTTIHIPRTVPFFSASGNYGLRLLYFPFLPPLASPVRVPGPAFVIQLDNKPNAWISFADSNVAAFCLVLNLNFTLPNTNRAPSRHPSDTSDARRRATVHRFSRFLHAHPKNSLTHNHLHRCARPGFTPLP